MKRTTALAWLLLVGFATTPASAQSWTDEFATIAAPATRNFGVIFGARSVSDLRAELGPTDLQLLD